MPSAGRSVRVDGHEVSALTQGWRAWTSGVEPLAARVPGTAAGALRDAGLWRPGDQRDLDAEEWWFATRFRAERARADEEVVLRLDGVATVAEVRLNGRLVAQGASMFAPAAVDVGALLEGDNELTIRCLPLRELLSQPRKPRARWRTRLVADGNLRFFRTTLLGRAPGFAPGPAPVGPWRPVVLERRRGFVIDDLALRPRLEGGEGVLCARGRVRGVGRPGPERVEVILHGPAGEHRASLVAENGVVAGELRVPDAAAWWPHTHGEPILHTVRLALDGVTAEAGRVGFRTLESPGDVEVAGVDLRVNGVPVFARGAVWTPVDFVGLAAGAEEVQAAIAQARDGGMNILRVPGTAVYEGDAFHDACDELGVLVWQDFMFANLDYPVESDDFRHLVEEEARELLSRRAGSPSLAVLCGNSEVEQQAAMLGLDLSLGRGELFGELLPRLVREAEVDAVYVPSAPSGGDLPFRPDRGVANYYGVGAYLRPLEDARRAGVRFAAECLAFANVPDEEAIAEILPDAPVHVVHHPRWKAGVPRDNGAGWDFEDVRDHYLQLLFGLDPVALRSVDPERYLELSRAVTGEVMAETLGEWRREGSSAHGAMVLWLRDLLPGAGWGLVDHRGEPKVAWYHVRRALAPVAVWTTDEGLGGIDVHVANDRAEPLRAELRVALYRGLEQRVEEAAIDAHVAAHAVSTHNVETLLGRFVDASWAYRFGPAGHDVLVASLEQGDELLSQAFRFPAGRPALRQSAADLRLETSVEQSTAEGAIVVVRTGKLAYGVRVRAQGLVASDDAFCVEPGRERRIALRPGHPGAAPPTAVVSALNLEGQLRLPLAEQTA
jgi:beta-mannosidase